MRIFDDNGLYSTDPRAGEHIEYVTLRVREIVTDLLRHDVSNRDIQLMLSDAVYEACLDRRLVEIMADSDKCACGHTRGEHDNEIGCRMCGCYRFSRARE